jgi:hypothetical protein
LQRTGENERGKRGWEAAGAGVELEEAGACALAATAIAIAAPKVD